MRRALMMAVAAVVLGGMALVGPPAAEACSLTSPGPTEQELLARADLVFEGVATSSEDPNAGSPTPSSGDPIVWTFVVERAVKGTASQPQEVSTARSGATCGVTFEVGTRYVVFANLVDGVFWTSLGSGTRQAAVESSTTTTTTRPQATSTTTTTVRPPRPARPAQPTRTRTIALTG